MGAIRAHGVAVKAPRPKQHLDKRVIETAVDGDWIRDDVVPGLILRCKNGRKTFALRYGAGRAGKVRWLTIGEAGKLWKPLPNGYRPLLTARMAREEALRLLGEKAAGRDPAQARDVKKSIPTVEEFAPQYLADHSRPHKAPGSVANDERLLPMVAKAFRHLRLDQIDVPAVTRWHLRMKATPFQANRMLALLSHLYTMATRWGLLPAGHPNPCKHVPRFREHKRKRFLSAAELARLGTVLADAERRATLPPTKRDGGPMVQQSAVYCLRLLIFTGARASEILNLRHRDLAGIRSRGLLEIQSKTGPRPLYFSAPAMALLNEIPRRAGNPWLLPGRRLGQHLTLAGLEQAWQVVRREARLEDVRIHDLRHSFASVLVSKGSTLPVIGALLGHTNVATTARYAHLSDDPLRSAAEVAADFIAKALKSKK